jgi:hypothetical protein
MIFTKPTPPADALAFANKVLVGSPLSSSEWQDVPVALRSRAFFSSRVESAQVLQQARNGITDFLENNLDDVGALKTGGRAQFVNDIQEMLARLGIEREGGGLTDITSQPRLSLIFNTQVRQADDYGYYRQGMDSDVLNEFPAQRFIRVMDVKEPRQSHQRFEDQVYLKTDPIWALEINKDFGLPFGPWGWGCGHDVEDVDRREAEDMGLLEPGERLQKSKPYDFNRGLEASIKNMDEDLVSKLLAAFGNKIKVEGDTMRWTGSEPPVEVQAETARSSPVSDALTVKVSGGLKDQVNAGIAAIDAVHDDGTLPAIPVVSTRQSYLGFMQFNRTVDGLAASTIAVRNTGQWPALTMVHETGHLLDLEAIGTKGQFSTLAGDAEMKQFLAAADQTAAIQGLRDKLNRVTSMETRRAIRYYLKPEEIWARAYAQYVSEQSGSPILLRQLDAARSAETGRQWDAEDFKPVAGAITAMFQKLGWL